MRRDPRLQGLSSDHHHALVLARKIRRAFESSSANEQLVDEVQARYERDLQPHFAIEEEELLPALDAAGAPELATRTRAEHEQLLALLAAARTGELAALRRFGALLEEHVRFEERELFVACEARLDDAVLEAVAARAPRPIAGRR